MLAKKVTTYRKQPKDATVECTPCTTTWYLFGIPVFTIYFQPYMEIPKKTMCRLFGIPVFKSIVCHESPSVRIESSL